MTTSLTVIAYAILLGLWTFMWLRWSFDGDVRAWLAALLFPASWRNGRDRSYVASRPPHLFTVWLTSGSLAPAFVCQVMSCRYCWSAHVAGSGAILVALTGALPAATIPLVWAAGAALGNIIYEHCTQPH